MQTHMIYEGDNDSRVDYYILAPGISILFNHIYTSTWEKGNMPDSDRILNLNFCINGRCDVSLMDHQYAIVKKIRFCLSARSCQRKTFIIQENYMKEFRCLLIFRC